MYAFSGAGVVLGHCERDNISLCDCDHEWQRQRDGMEETDLQNYQQTGRADSGNFQISHAIERKWVRNKDGRQGRSVNFTVKSKIETTINLYNFLNYEIILTKVC